MIRISVKVKPGAREEKLEKISEKEFSARLVAPAQDGKANAALVKLLSKYFDKPKSMIIITHGFKGRNKIVEVLE